MSAESARARNGSARVGALALAVAVASLALTAGHLAAFHTIAHLPGVNVWSLAACFALAEALPVHFEHRREAISITLSTFPLVIGLVGVGPVALVAARLAGSAVTLTLHRRQQLAKLSVNLASFWLQTAISVLVFRAVAGHSHGPGSWPGLLVAVLAGDSMQTLVLSAAISLYQGRWEHSLLNSAATSCAAAVVETSLGILAVILLTTQPVAMAPLGVVTGLVLLSYRTHRSLGDRHRELTQLYDFASVMGDALLEGRVADSLLEQARTVMHAEQAWLYLHDFNDFNMHGQLTRVCNSSGTITVEPDDGLGVALQQIVGSDDGACLIAATDERVRELTSGRDLKELLVAPLTGRSGLIGTLVVVNRSGQVRKFVKKDLRLFATIANHARVSIENDTLVDRLRERAAESEHQSLHDALTGLPNRVLFSRLVSEAIEDSSPAAVLLLDLDRFKEVNDTLGHHNGDLLLQQVGARLRTTLRRGDIIARLGGDEFGVLLPDIQGEHAALQVGRGIVELLEHPFQVGDMSIDVGASIGIALAPRDGVDTGTLVQRADVAMYTAKADQTGVEVYRPDRDGYSPERLMLVGELKQAVQQHQLDVHYQPQLDLATGEVVGVEALVRWTHPTRGTIPADQFVAIAEHTGLIQPLTLFVLDQALASARQWRNSGNPLRVSVNLSARTLVGPNLVEDVAALLTRHQMPASALCLEVTESSIMGDPRRSTATLTALRNLGVTISIDDFGTGQSSLAYIKRLPVGEIKIEKSFVLSMVTDRSAEAIVETVINLGHNLGIPVTAEGIEDDATLNRLREMGCPFGQGYHFARPMPDNELVTWLADHGPAKRSHAVVSLIGSRDLSMVRTG